MVKKSLWVILVLVSIFGVLMGLNAPFLVALAKEEIVLLLDFREYEVDTFDNRKMLRSSTDNLSVKIITFIDFNSSFSDCPTVDKTNVAVLRLNLPEQVTLYQEFKIKCSKKFTMQSFIVDWPLSNDDQLKIKDIIYNSDQFLTIQTGFYDPSESGVYNNLTRYFREINIYSEFILSFNTTYFYDQIIYEINYEQPLVSTNFNYYDHPTDINTKLIVSDSNFSKITLINQDPTQTIFRGLKKYLFTIPNKHLTSNYLSTTVRNYWDSYDNNIGYIYTNNQTNYLYPTNSINIFNISNTGANFPAPSTNTALAYIDPCPIWNMQCGFNNLLTYLVQDAPILSDLSALIGSGWSILSNSFYGFTGLLGVYLGANFENLNIFVLIIGVAIGVSIIIWAVRDL